RRDRHTVPTRRSSDLGMAAPTGGAPGTKLVRRERGGAVRKVEADICVVGAGAAGTSAAIEAARLGRKVVLIDGMPALGGQAVNSDRKSTRLNSSHVAI